MGISKSPHVWNGFPSRSARSLSDGRPEPRGFGRNAHRARCSTSVFYIRFTCRRPVRIINVCRSERITRPGTFRCCLRLFGTPLRAVQTSANTECRVSKPKVRFSFPIILWPSARTVRFAPGNGERLRMYVSMNRFTVRSYVSRHKG